MENMEIYYLFNSGFTIEHGNDALIFDYYKGSLNKSWAAPVNNEPSLYRNVYVFSSHIHMDHFNEVIFDWRHERGDVNYILSEDIIPAVPAAVKQEFGRHTLTFLKEGSHSRVGGLNVAAYGSTDAGVSFHVTTEDGLSMFHAGDFNYWHWREESTGEEITEAYEMFVSVLKSIQQGIDKLDVAFFPVDPRMGEDYYRGAIMFCETMKPAVLIPMHFGSEFNPPAGFYADIPPYTKVLKPGPKAGKIER